MTGKLYIIISFCIISNFMPAESQWLIEKSPTERKLNAIASGGDKVWIVGDNGTILFRNATEWIHYNSITSENLYSIFMMDNISGWIVGAKGTILKYDGKNWNSVSSPTTKNLHSVFFRDKNNGIAVGESGTVLICKGDNWKIYSFPTNVNLFSVFFKDNEVWIGGGLECVNVPIFKMLYDNNESIANTSASFSTIYSIYFPDQSHGWAVGSPSTLMSFNGFGWEQVEISESYPSLLSLHFQNESNGMCVGYQGTILIFKDGQWSKEKLSVDEDLYGCLMKDGISYAVGDKGIILRKDQSNVNDNYPGISEKFDLLDIYPNPCNTFLEVEISDDKDYDTRIITITNTSGNILMKKEYSGKSLTDKLRIDVSELKNGMYFITLNSGKTKYKSLKFVVKH